MSEINKSNGANMEYTGKNIRKLSDMEAIRTNTSQFVGDDGDIAVRRMFGEIFDNSSDECILNKGHIDVIINLGLEEVTVKDTGRGIPVDAAAGDTRPAIRVAFEELNAGGKTKTDVVSAYAASTGVHGIGATATNALSNYFNAETNINGIKYTLKYAKGQLVQDLTNVGKTSDVGTKIQFQYDRSVMKTADQPYVANYFKDYIVDRVTFNDISVMFTAIVPNTPKFEYDVEAYTNVFGEGVPCECELTTGEVVPGFKYEKSFSHEEYNIESFTSGINEIGNQQPIRLDYDTGAGTVYNIYGGFKDAFSNSRKQLVVNGLKMREARNVGNIAYHYEQTIIEMVRAKLEKDLDPEVRLDDSSIQNYINYVIIVKSNDRDFGDQAKTSYVSSVPTEHVMKIKNAIHIDSSLINSVSSTVLRVYKAKIEDAKRRAMTAEIRKAEKNVKADMTLSKFRGCTGGKEASRLNRLWILEGDSAGNAFAMERDPKFDGYMPLMGKPVNAIKNGIVRDKEGTPVINLQYKMLKDAIESKMYENYIIATDADIDGKHIQNLILYMFFQHFPQVIQKGQLYIALPPLYSLTVGGKQVYAYSDEEKNDMVAKGGKVIHRYKGLGEMETGTLYKALTQGNNFVRIKYNANDEQTNYLVTALASEDTTIRRHILETNDIIGDSIVNFDKNKLSAAVARVNPMYLDDDGTPMGQGEVDLAMAINNGTIDNFFGSDIDSEEDAG